MKKICSSLYQKIRSSISLKFLFTFLILLIIPLMILTQLFINRLHMVLRDKEQDSINEKIRFVSSEFDRIFSDMDRITTSLIMDYHVTDILCDPAAIPSYEWFSGYKSMNSLLSLLTSNSDCKYSITVLSADNKLYQSGAAYNTMLTVDSPIFEYIREGNGQSVIFNRNLNRFDDNALISFGRSVFQKGTFLGTILVELPISYLDQLLSPFDSGATQMYVLKDNSTIIYSSVQTDDAAVPEALHTALEDNASSITLDNTNYLMQQTLMEQSHLSVTALVTAVSVFQESTDVITGYVVGFCLIIASTIIGIFILTWFFTRDIKELNTAVSRFGSQADREISLPVRSLDEVGQLTDGVISMSHRIRKLLSQIRENERNKRILEFNSLQTQINPHMIYNTLNTITYLAEVQNVKNIREVSSSFAFLLRSLSNQGELITITQEIDYLQAFITLKKYNLLCNIETDFQIDEEARGCLILKLLLQPIVENAVIHGFSNRMEDGLLCIRIRRQDGLLFIDVSDNGNGMDEANVQKIMHEETKNKNTFLRVGIKNIIERLHLQYGDDADFTIMSAPDCGTTVHITFPAMEGGDTNDSNPVS